MQKAPNPRWDADAASICIGDIASHLTHAPAGVIKKRKEMTTLKTIAAIVTTAAITAPVAAQAQTSTQTLYGLVDVTVRHANNVGANGASLNSMGDGLFTGSRLGFRGTEDLGGGLRALYTLEMGLDPSSGIALQSTATGNYGQAASASGRAFGRELWVGVGSSALGTLTLGRQYTLAHQAAGRIQPQSNPNLDAITVFANHHIARQDNMVKYVKELGPVSLAGSVTLSEALGRGSALSATYTSGPVDAVVYGQNMSAATGGETRKIRGAGLAYQFAPVLKGFAGYMTRSHEISAQRNKVALIGASYNITPTLVLSAAYSEDRQNRFGTTASGTRQTTWLAADYFLSKRTDLYAEVDHNKLSGGYVLPAFMGSRGSQTGVTVGLRHRF